MHTPLLSHVLHCSIAPHNSKGKLRISRWQRLRFNKPGALFACTCHTLMRLTCYCAENAGWFWPGDLLLAYGCVHISHKHGMCRIPRENTLPTGPGGWTAAEGAQEDLLGCTKEMIEFLFLLTFFNLILLKLLCSVYVFSECTKHISRVLCT